MSRLKKLAKEAKGLLNKTTRDDDSETWVLVQLAEIEREVNAILEEVIDVSSVLNRFPVLKEFYRG